MLVEPNGYQQSPIKNEPGATPRIPSPAETRRKISFDDIDINSLEVEERIRITDIIRGRTLQRTPVENSVIRINQQQSISADLQQGFAVAVRGTRRIGKTSMLKTLVTMDSGIFINTQRYNYGQEKYADTLLTFGIDDIADFFSRQKENNRSTEKWKRKAQIKEEMRQANISPFEALNTYVENKTPILIAIDEVVAIPTKEFFQFIVNLRQYSNLRIAVDLARVSQYEQMALQIFGDFKEHYIQGLSHSEIEDFLKHIVSDYQIWFQQGAIKEIGEFSGGRPMEINQVLYELFFNESKTGGAKSEYDLSDIQQITKAALTRYKPAFSVVTDNYEEEYYRALNDRERNCLQLMLRKGMIPESEIDPDIVTSLLLLNFIKRDIDTKDLSINGRLFEQVLRERVLNERRHS